MYWHVIYNKTHYIGTKPSGATYQSAQYEDDHEGPAYGGITHQVTIAHRGHGNNHYVHTLPVGQLLLVGEVEEWVPGGFHLRI